MNRRIKLAALMLCVALSGSGCTLGNGLLYTNVIEPLDLNMSNTPVGNRQGESRLTRVVEPFTGANMAVEINSNAIADAARRSGLTVVHYADLRRKEILFGIWQERTVVVYGE